MQRFEETRRLKNKKRRTNEQNHRISLNQSTGVSFIFQRWGGGKGKGGERDRGGGGRGREKQNERKEKGMEKERK